MTAHAMQAPLGQSQWRFHATVFPTHPDFGNSAEEFYPHETLSAPMKLLSSLFINTVPHQHN
jgi:hypothetical protein